MKMQWGLMKQSVILPHKFTANTLWTRSFHDHDFDTILDNLKIKHYFDYKCNPCGKSDAEKTFEVGWSRKATINLDRKPRLV